MKNYSKKLWYSVSLFFLLIFLFIYWVFRYVFITSLPVFAMQYIDHDIHLNQIGHKKMIKLITTSIMEAESIRKVSKSSDNQIIEFQYRSTDDAVVKFYKDIERYAYKSGIGPRNMKPAFMTNETIMLQPSGIQLSYYSDGEPIVSMMIYIPSFDRCVEVEFLSLPTIFE